MANTTPSSPTNTNVAETATLNDNNNVVAPPVPATADGDVVVVPAVTSETVVVSLLDDGTDNDGGAVPMDTTENRDETTAVTNTAGVVIPIPTNCSLPPVVVTAETFFAALPGMMTGEESTTPTDGGEGSSQAPPPHGDGAEFTIVYCPTTGNGMYMTPPVQPRGEQESNIPPSIVSASLTTVPAGSSAPESSQRRNPPPPCQVCNKRYTSWKALFGHMRSHPDRPWRGVHPPPRFDRHRQRGNNPIVLHA